MKFLVMLAASFSMLYLVLVVHAFSFPTQKKAEEIEALSLHVKEKSTSGYASLIALKHIPN